MNIQQALEELISAGFSQRKIGDAVGTSQPTIHRLLTGQTQRIDYELGLSILKLYAEHLQKTPQSA